MLSVLHLRRGRFQPARKHHRLGVVRFPFALRRSVHFALGHFPLRLRAAASSDYRERYEKNLKRDLPHIPLAPEFRAFASAGAELADLHVNYESAEPYALQALEKKDAPVDLLVGKMRLSKDKQSIRYNDFLTLSGIPPAALEYRLGNRSALEWVVNQYQVKTDKRSGIVNDPNRPDDPQYIVRLIQRVVTISLKTVEIVKALRPLDILTENS